ncbi:hypothetical protein Tco_1306423, partial [Tanacetum coccineum]
ETDNPETKALKKRFSKKEKFNLLNIAEDLFSYEIPSANNLKLDERSDGDEIGVKKFSMDPSCKPLDDALDINNVTSNEFERKSRKFDSFKNDLDWFKYDTPIKKGFDEFCKCWWGKEGIKEELSDGGWSNCVPNDEWKHLEVMKNDPNQASRECIREYGVMINDNDFKYMCDYLLSKDKSSFMNDIAERIEEKRYKLVGTPSERIASLNLEFDDWAKANGFTEEAIKTQE